MDRDFDSTFYRSRWDAFSFFSWKRWDPSTVYEISPITERLVQAIWADQLFKKNHLTTLQGRKLKILDPGRWNSEGGPDFRYAKLWIDQEWVEGDVEVHLETTGWNSHMHFSDAKYNHVVLDICLWQIGQSTPIRRLDGGKVDQLVLSGYLDSSLDELAEVVDFDAYPFAPLRHRTMFSQMKIRDLPLLKPLIESAGVFRLEKKSEMIRSRISQVGGEQVLFELFARALGYKNGANHFQQMVTQLGWNRFFHAKSFDERWDLLVPFLNLNERPFSLGRPLNHPHRRLAGLVLLLEGKKSLVSWVNELGQKKENLSLPPRLLHPFWSYHFHLESNRFEKPVALIGMGRWRELVVNAILPYLHAQAVAMSDSKEQKETICCWMNFPLAPSNRLIREVAHELKNLCITKNGIQQGLIQWNFDFFRSNWSELVKKI